jgi:hypothetical protein
MLSLYRGVLLGAYFGLNIPFDPIKIRSYLSYSIATVVLQESVMPYDSI